MRRKSRIDTTVLTAIPRAAALMVLEISHSINSTSTAAEAKVAEKTNAEIRLMVGLVVDNGGRTLEVSLRLLTSPESNGKIF